MRRREFIAFVCGTALARPFATRAQQSAKINRIAIVHPTIPVRILSDLNVNPNLAAFIGELGRLGHVDGANLIIDRYSAEGVPERLTELARDVVRQAPDLIFVVSAVGATAIKEATHTIPIVTITSDPIAMGFAVSLARPGGNITGVAIDAGLEVWEKRIELLREVVPTAATVAFATSREYWDHPYGHAVQHAAQKAGILLTLLELQSPVLEPEYRRAFAALREQGVGALVMNDGPGPLVHRQLIVQLAEEIRVPTIYPFREFVNVGGLMAYAVEGKSLHVHAARQVDQILKGANPSETPFYQATRFELVINLKTAKALGLTVPPVLLARADEVIE